MEFTGGGLSPPQTLHTDKMRKQPPVDGGCTSQGMDSAQHMQRVGEHAGVCVHVVQGERARLLGGMRDALAGLRSGGDIEGKLRGELLQAHQVGRRGTLHEH